MSRRVALGVAGGVIVASAVGIAVLPRDEDVRLPATDPGAGTAMSYRVVYEVDTNGEHTTEELRVRRPFDARLTVTDADGELVSERSSALGKLVTRARGARATSIAVPVAPATADQRLDALGPALIDDGRLRRVGQDEVAGRECTVTSERDDRAGLDVERCVDDEGVLLRERWVTGDDAVVLERRAVELEIGTPGSLEPPDAEPLPDDQGNGAIRRDDDAEVPFVERFVLDAPRGFDFAGRYAVVPPALGLIDDPMFGSQTALITDVWTRGPDVVVLDQGASKSGPPPFDATTVIRTEDLDGLGTVEIAADARLAEVRATREDGGFLRVAGTLPPDDLLAIARGAAPEEATHEP